MEADDRIQRLERAVVALGEAVTRNHPLRPSLQDQAGIDALQALVNEVHETRSLQARATRRQQLEDEISRIDDLGDRLEPGEVDRQHSVTARSVPAA